MEELGNSNQVLIINEPLNPKMKFHTSLFQIDVLPLKHLVREVDIRADIHYEQTISEQNVQAKTLHNLHHRLGRTPTVS